MLAQVLTSEGARTRRLIGVTALAAVGLYVLALDQGLILSLLQGSFAVDANMVHELLHDGRHVLGAPCH